MSISAIASLTPNSPAKIAGIEVGERLISINDHPILDVLDYKFYSYESKLQLVLANSQTNPQTQRSVTISKEEGADLGINFETYLMDSPRSCANDCVFCFVDQMPPNMRETLYFKDDDARLSFLTGNYITLTNLSQREIQRILDLRISPINISVHATNPDLRVALLKHPKAGNCMDIMKRFAQGNITMNCQIVACPTLNDGEHLQQSLQDLATLYPQVNSVSVVPVGLTKYRDKLTPLLPYNKATATEVLSLVESFAQQHKAETGTSFAWCSDEFYLLAEKNLPQDEYYEEYSQWENGVGMLSLFRSEFLLGMKTLHPEDYSKARSFTIATGTAAAPMLEELLAIVEKTQREQGYPTDAKVYGIQNDFFGHTVTVAGLITATDLIQQLQGKVLASPLLISQSMLRHGEEVFLDDITLKQVEETLQVKILPVPQDGMALVEAIYDPDYSPETATISPIMSQEAHPYNPSTPK